MSTEPIIDPHVHCRDEGLKQKATIASTLELATRQGVEIIFDEPNNDPLTIDEKSLVNRLKLVPLGQERRYFIYLGLTSDQDQIAEVVRCHNLYPQVIGLKLFAGSSYGKLAVLDYSDQLLVYQRLTYLDYTGVLPVHCEKESLLLPQRWDPTWPETHSCARPKEAEIESVKDQITIAIQTGFPGTLHICHISCPESVDLVDQARTEMKITCGLTPHHAMWDVEQMNLPDGLMYKMNPPLRDAETVQGLRRRLIDGKIDWIETDHAPHTYNEKYSYPHLSGYPSLTLYKQFVEKFLPDLGLTQEQIHVLTSGNIIRTFGSKLRQAGIDV